MSTGSRQIGTVLREPGFRRILSARVAGSLGDGCFQAGLASFALFSPEQAPSAAAIAGGFALLLLPFTLLGPVAGVLLDRWSRRRVLIVANLFRAAVLGILAVLLSVGAGGVPFIALALVALAANRLILAALSASLPHVLPSELLVPGNGLAPTLGTVAYVIGTGVGTMARGVPSLVIAAILYAGAASVARALPWLGPDVSTLDRTAREELRKVVSAIADARHHLNRRAVTALATITALRLPVGLLIVMTLLIERAEEDAGGSALSGLGVILAASGLGFAAAALLTPQVVARFGLPRTVSLQLTCAALATLLAIPLTQAALAAAAFFVAWATQGVKICVDTAVQREVADIYRGRVFTLYDILFNCGFVAATVVAALVLPPGGGSVRALLLMAVSYLVIAVASGPGWTDSRQHPVNVV